MVQVFKPQRKPKKTVSGHITLDVSELDLHGLGVSRNHSPVVFVEGGLPGERCQVSLIQRQKRFWRARVTKVLSESDKRQLPPCDYFNHCGGCQTQHVSPEFMLESKRRAIDTLLTKLSDSDNLPWQAPLAGQPLGYRRKTRIAVDARRDDDLRIGFRQQASNTIIDIPNCQVLTPALQKAFKYVREAVRAMQKPQWLGHIGLFEGAEFVQISLHAKRGPGKTDLAQCQRLAEQGNYQVIVNLPGGNRHSFGGKGPACYTIDPELHIELEPSDFVQVNATINQQMIEQAIDWLEIDKHDHILDLYCGVGNFSLPIARQAGQVTGVEGVANMVQKSHSNALKNGIDNTSFVHADLNDDTALKNIMQLQHNKLLLDPSREGAAKVAEALAKQGCENVLYVSCNPSSFARDAQTLMSGGYQMKKVGLMDMFAYTEHCELMALFTRPATKQKQR